MADLDDIKDGKDFRTDQPQKNIPFTGLVDQIQSWMVAPQPAGRA